MSSMKFQRAIPTTTEQCYIWDYGTKGFLDRIMFGPTRASLQVRRPLISRHVYGWIQISENPENLKFIIIII